MQLMHHVERNIDGRGNYIFGADWYHNYWGKDVTLAHKKYIIHWPASSNLYTMIYVRWVCQTYLQSTLIPFVTVHVLCISFSRHLRPLGLWKVGFFLRLLEWITPTVAWPWEVEVSLWLVNPGQSQPHRSLLLNFLVLGVCVCGYQISCLHLLCVCVWYFSTYCYMLSYALCLPPIGCHTVFVSAAKELLSNERGDSPEDLARHMGHLRLLPELVPTFSTWDALDLRWIRAPAEASIHIVGVGRQDELQGNLGVGRTYCETLQEWCLDQVWRWRRGWNVGAKQVIQHETPQMILGVRVIMCLLPRIITVVMDSYTTKANILGVYCHKPDRTTTRFLGDVCSTVITRKISYLCLRGCHYKLCKDAASTGRSTTCVEATNC